MTKETDMIKSTVLPMPDGFVQPPAVVTDHLPAAVVSRAQEIDFAKIDTIIGFGAKAQTELQAISQEMLGDVKSKATGPAGDALSRMVSTLRGFNDEPMDGRDKPSLWEKMTGKLAPAARFLARHEEVRGQISMIADDLLRHESALMKDIGALDVLYGKAHAFYGELGLYIQAGEARLAQADRIEIPAKEAEMAAAPEADKMLRAQELRDLRAARDDLERRVHDLRLTRQVTMQSLPSIRLVQENDKGLVAKIKSTLVNTVPLWETQLAQAITIQRSRAAAEVVRDATDLTNALLVSNAQNLQQANQIVRQEMERGVFDIAAIRAANESLIATIDETLAIADQGKQNRAAAEVELVRMEGELRDTLASARARGLGAGQGAK